MFKNKIFASVSLSAIMGVIFTLISSSTATAYTIKQAPIMTEWASKINTSSPLPEYPRPQMTRSDWLNLNGVWQFKSGTANDSVPIGQNLSGDILVPYPVESAISGVMKHYDRVWYRRSFTVPSTWSGKRIILNFGAVDWESQVYINGKSLGIHKGGYDPFSYDVTPYLVGTGAQEIIVRVYDPTDSYGQPRGKQTTQPGGIMYTPSTGIWQTVWLEPVAETSINNLKIIPDIDNSRLKLTVNTTGLTSGITVTATAKDGTTIVKAVDGTPNTEMYIPISNPKLWSPNNPFLYDLNVVIKNGTTTIDTVNSYFGMRKISVANVSGVQKLMLNNQFLFEMGPLDQGFWPDGLYTAPTDAALKFDIEQEKAMGFNMVRKHIKVEPQRWYYWADKLGIMVWQDMPSANSYIPGGVTPPPIDKAQYELELRRMIANLYNSPSIIMWVIFNESQGQFDTERLVGLAKSLDPSRLTNQASGGSHYNVGDVLDIHAYPDPGVPSGSSTQALANGEFGGIGYKVPGHMWDPNSWGYTMVSSPDEFANLYDYYATSLTGFKTNNGLSAAVYTETTDVEVEINGFLTYDRRATKVDINRIKASNEKIINQSLTIGAEVLPTSKTTGRTWKYTTGTPAANWNTNGFSDAAWNSGQAGFGTPVPGGIVRTTWNTPDIWMRQTFNPGTLTANDINNLSFIAHHDDNSEIYINGVLATTLSGYTTAYSIAPLSQASKNAIISNGNNVIAVHCKQQAGGQYMDVGISKVTYSYTQPSSAGSALIDNFEDGNANGFTNYGGTWSVTNGQYNVGANAGAKSIANGMYFSNFTYDADVSVNGGDAGLLFRVTKPTSGVDSYTGYYVGINANQVVLGKANNNWTQIATSPMTTTANTMYHIRVVTNDSNIKVYVSDMNTPKINITDTSYAFGTIGLRTYNSVAKFDNILVKQNQGRFEAKNMVGNFIRHQNSRGYISGTVSPIEDCGWKVVPGLADPSCVSLESVNYPGMFLRHRSGEIWLDTNDNSAVFKADATWRIKPGLADSSMFSFESYNFPGEYIRHNNSMLYRTSIVTDLDKNDATFREVY
ncbi:MAG: AbfB domain-containing protein [Clostridiaceae bacterium]|nr:AbfB domain-containing protein [Clostridiaceae bacterium]